jgi:hypothetical protein
MELSRFSDEQLRDLAVRATVHIQQLGMRVGAHDYPTWGDQLRMELTISGEVLCQVEAEQRRRVGNLNIE